MRNRSGRFPFILGALALTASIMLGMTPGSAVARDLNPPPLVTSPTVRGPDLGEIQSLRSIQQRLDFQRQRQINSEIDALSARQRQPRIEVPVLKPGCGRSNTGGSYAARNC